MTNTYEFSNLTTRDQKDYLAKLTKMGIKEIPISYFFEDELTEEDETAYEESSTVDGIEVVSVDGTLFAF